jgi:uncharacterized membrane protein YqjE
MEPAPPVSAGFIGSFRALGDGLLATVQDRLDLFSLELQEEKFRLIQTILWICAVVCTGMLAMTFVSIGLVYLFWESARLAVLGGLALGYAALFAATMVSFRRFLVRQPEPFLATRQELEKDRACIRNDS